MRNTDRNFDYSRTYYLAGPMTNYPEFNYPAFERLKVELENNGIAVKSPHTIPWPDAASDGEELWQAMMRKALQMLLECEGIILMQGWIRSRGALVEYNIAAALQMPAYLIDGKFLVPMHDPAKIGV